MTRKQIRTAVSELRCTLRLHRYESYLMYQEDNRRLSKIATLAYKAATFKAQMEAQAFTISCLWDDIRRLRPELKDCIAKEAGTSLPLGGGEDYTSPR